LCERERECVCVCVRVWCAYSSCVCVCVCAVRVCVCQGVGNREGMREASIACGGVRCESVCVRDRVGAHASAQAKQIACRREDVMSARGGALVRVCFEVCASGCAQHGRCASNASEKRPERCWQ
jgi:hypothetical protein